MEIFERIKKLAEQEGISLQVLSKKLGLSDNYIYNLKYKKKPSAENLSKIANYFNVSIDYLLGNEKVYKQQGVLDLVELAHQPKDFNWDHVLSAGGKPIDEEDKAIIRRLFSHKIQ